MYLCSANLGLSDLLADVFIKKKEETNPLYLVKKTVDYFKEYYTKIETVKIEAEVANPVTEFLHKMLNFYYMCNSTYMKDEFLKKEYMNQMALG